MDLPANQPTFDDPSGVVTIPTVTGVAWKVNNVDVSPGAQAPITTGNSSTVTAHATSGYTLQGTTTWTFTKT
jgi:hypothetical protein